MERCLIANGGPIAISWLDENIDSTSIAGECDRGGSGDRMYWCGIAHFGWH